MTSDAPGPAAGALPLGRAAIESVIPHRAPFLLLDEVHALEPGVRARGRWRITGGEDFLRGHFPGNPIVPGVLMVESLAQLGAVCALTHPDHTGKFGVFAGIDGIRFRRIVRPGDVLDLAVEVDRLRGSLGRMQAEARVGDDLAVSGLLTFGLLPEAPA